MEIVWKFVKIGTSSLGFQGGGAYVSGYEQQGRRVIRVQVRGNMCSEHVHPGTG